MLPSSQRERRVSRLNRTGNNKTGWARRLTALLITACLVMAMALPVYAEVDLLPDAPGEVELLEDEPGTASGEDTTPPEQNAATPVPDAATPEPEQSAEPEQPAPTETPEPTAEPTPTPEPTATATATPVPTVTPTATPEPTEQPQKMYAAESVDSVQAVSEQEATDGFTVYFVVPNMINGQTVSASHEIRFNVKTDETPGNSNDGKWWHTHTMEPTGWETNGHKIYAVKNCKDIKGDKFLEIQFQLYEGSDWKGQITLNNNLGPISDFNNKMYDPTANDNKGGWTDNPVLKEHTYYAGKPIKFENRSAADLTNVKANFYIPGENGALTPVNGASDAKDVPQGKFVSFNIPNEACSYVQFTWNEGGKSKYYNFYSESVSDNDKESFMYSETSNCFIYTGADNVRWGRENSFRIYYDATFSWLSYENETSETHGAIGCGMPTKDGKLWCYLTGDGKVPITKKEMNRLKDTNIWYCDVPDGYTKIRFASWAVENEKAADNGDGTAMMDIPADLSEPCFFADASDDVIYKGGNRGGYWAEKGTLRDAEKWKKTGTKVVDIKPAEFTEEPDTKYVTSTLYDYYTDYELNGKNRDTYKYNESNKASYRNWVTFREFDQALSDYYKKANAQYPIYTGHFQPTYSDWGYTFEGISAALNLWGFNRDFENKSRFMAINNSTINEDGVGTRYDYAYQGLVADTTSNGKATGEPLLKGTEIVEPHFNKDFLLRENSKNAKLGEVYENVKFPFTKVENLFGNEPDVDYWCFDSKDTTLYLKQDSGQNPDSKYFLQSQSTSNRESSKNTGSTSNETPKILYGYFPFNETADPGVASTYNYGFGTKLQMDFTLTDDGMLETDNGNGTKVKTSIKFFFSGDDDVWVFIDGKLALDVGGAHGKVSGLLEFGEKEEEGKKKNSVTAYVSKVKKGGTPESNQNGSPAKTVKYNGEDINFYAQGTTLTFDKGQKHTLTMYYMERGMWESNMAVAFNFPDNNELQVQKEVDLTNVTDDDFKNCFKNQKIFNFTIQNQATHYGEKVAAKPDTGGIRSQVVDLTENGGNTFKPATEPTESNKGDYIFELATNPEQGSGQDTKQVLHWYARYTDTQPVSKEREKRYGILTLNEPINIEKMRFLTFQVYVSQEDGGELSLNNLYLELLDNQKLLDPQKSPGQKGSLGTTGINGATYGSVELKTDEWVTVKLDLHKMKEQGDFNGNVQTIRVGDNYSRNIYFRDFTFIPKVVPSKMTGFTTDQEKIPDYGSATTGQLKNAENAQYTSNMDTDTQLVDGDGRFVLEAGETVTFSDQFRRGSYISLKEDLNQSLYDTTWTVYENGQAVESTEPTGSASHVTFEKFRSLNSQNDPAKGPDDGRTEKITDETEQESGNVKNIYNGQKPTTANTIVFRSYKNPDEKSSTLTKLKVEYVNTVKTGGLKIQKKAAAGEENTIKGTYTFKVTFNDVGGEGLEEKPIERTVTIDMSTPGDHTATITGIPVGTRYTIEEVAPEDGSSRLQSVTVPPGCNSAHLIKNNTMVEGVIEKSEDPELTAIFTNTNRTLINIEFDKHWKDADGKDIGTAQQPDEIYIQLQRRLKTDTTDADWEPVKYPTTTSPDPNYVIIKRGDNGWKYTFSNLDQYPINGSADNNYIYRIVEGTVDEAGNFTAADGTITIKGNTYVVTAKATPKSETDSETGATTTPATVTPDGTITGGSGKIELTNTLQNPKFALDIIKKDAELNNESQEVFLKDVEFKLEKLKETTTEGKTQYTVDTGYKFSSNENKNYLTGITGADGKITGVFKNLEPGTYRLTETKAHPGYNLLAQPIEIKFTQDGKCYIDGEKITDTKTFVQSGNTYTMTLTVLNRKTPELPHTGADAPSLWLLIGMPLAVAGLLIFTFRYNRKGGRRH